MSVLSFMIKKALRKAVVTGLVIGALSCVFLFFMMMDNSVFDKAYKERFGELSRSEDPYSELESSEKNITESRARIYRQIDEWQNEHSEYGKPPAPLSKELTEELIRERTADSSSSPERLTPLIKAELSAQKETKAFIIDRRTGYTRNIRRGVKDEYSLSVSDFLIEDYGKVLERLEGCDKLIDTRAANSLNDYLSGEVLLTLGVFVLMFSVFSSEKSSGRFRAFAVTKTGAFRFTFCKIVSAMLSTLLFIAVGLAIPIIMTAVLSPDKADWSMPVQYLKGFELSARNMSFFGYIGLVCLLKAAYLMTLSSCMLLVSMLSPNNLISGAFSFIAVVLVFLKSRLADGSAAMTVITGDFVSMLNDRGYVPLFAEPVKLYVLFLAGALMLSAVILGLTLILSKRKGI